MQFRSDVVPVALDRLHDPFPTGLIMLLLFLFLFQAGPLPFDDQAAFYKQQMRYPRVRAAMEMQAEPLARLIAAAEVGSRPDHLLIRVFKQDRRVECWMRSGPDQAYKLVTKYQVCDLSGVPGPKRKQGDLQIPEGFYEVDRFNPASSFHLSLGIDYPNRADRILGDRHDPGGDIFIHGSCVTIGCVPITDRWIRQLYLMAVWARANGGPAAAVHIYPARMTETNRQNLVRQFPQHADLWRQLTAVHDYFQKHHRIPRIRIAEDGSYRIRPQ